MTIQWIALALVVVAGVAIGFNDVRRLKLRRIWALAGVCYTESMRRKVFLVTPLAIAGVIVVSQLQGVTDDQDAIRQTAKFCVFATGLVVVITALILACTNLPREIESRVIFTIVTKPTTRLEIVLGKVVGFARVTAVVLLIMGVFSFVYLETRNHLRREAAAERLIDVPEGAAGRPTLAHYAEHGFLETRSFNAPTELNIYSRLPSDNVRWMRGGSTQYFVSHFVPTLEERGVLTAAADENAEVDILTTLQLERVPTTHEEQVQAVRSGIPPLHPVARVPFGPSPTSAPAAPAMPTEFQSLIRYGLVNAAGGNVVKPEEIGTKSDSTLIEPGKNGKPGNIQPLSVNAVRQLSDAPDFYVDVAGLTPGLQYGAGPLPVVLFIPAANNGAGMVIRPPSVNGQPELPRFLSRPSKYGMVVLGAADEGHAVADFSFRGAYVPPARNGTVAFEMDTQIEHTGDYGGIPNGQSICLVEVVNSRTGKSSGPIRVAPDLNHLTFFDVPVEVVDGGDFDVYLRGLLDGQWVEVHPQSIALITAERSFAGNLVKSFLLLWMLSILVIAISVFCSTFLSWPIAVVVTLILLLGRWGVTQLGDTLDPGIGRSVASDFFVKDAAESKVVSSAVEALSRGLRTVAVVLPDVSQFPASEDLERGISIPMAVMGEAAKSLLLYGTIVIIGGYLILRFAEVAP
jgi:hypothetical protein